MVEAAKGATSVDDLGNSNAEMSIGDRRHAYQWDRPYLVPLPVAVAEGAKEVAKLDGKLIVQPGMHATIEIKGEQLKSKEPFRGGVFAVMLNGMETKEDTLAFGYSLFMPVPKQDNNSKDFMAAMQAASLQPEIRAVLIDENGVAYSSTRNSSLNVKRNVDATTTRSLQQELSARMKGYEPKNTKEQSKSRTKISYELNVNNYMTQFSKVPPGTKIRALQLTIVKPTAQAFPVSYSLQHIPLDVRRTSIELAAACNTPVANEAMDSNEAPDMNVVKSEVTVEKNGTGIKTNTVLSGSGVQTNTTTKSTSPATALAEESPLFASEPKAGGYRIWRDASGSFSVEAMLVKSDGKSVQLKKKDGKIVTVPLEKLSDADKKFLSK